MIYLIDPITIQLGSTADSAQFSTHLRIQQSRLRAQKLVKDLRPLLIEDSNSFKRALLATSIELVIRSLALNEDKETEHHRRSLETYPHRQYRVTLTETPTFAGHLGSLGYAAVEQQIVGEPIEALQQIIDTFFTDHNLHQGYPAAQQEELLDNLNFNQHSAYITQLQDLLTNAANYNNPLLAAYNVTLNSVSDLKYRLLLGAYSTNLITVIEYFQALSNSLGGGLLTYLPSFVYQLLAPTLSFGYTAGPALFYQAVIVQQLIELYKSVPDNAALDSIPTELGLLRLYSICDAFSVLGRHNSASYARGYQKRYQQIIKAWAQALNLNPAISTKPDYKNYRLLDTDYLDSQLPVTQDNQSVSILLTADSTKVLQDLELRLLPLSRTYTEVVLVVGDYYNLDKDTYLDTIILNPMGSSTYKVTLTEPMVGYAVLMVNNTVISNIVIFEVNSLALLP